MSPRREQLPTSLATRRSRRASVAALLLFAGTLSAQTTTNVVPATNADDIVQAYLAENQLLEPLASMLRARLSTSPAEERPAAAERLGALYVKMLARATTTEQRQDLEARAQDLLKTVPESDSFALRLDLAKATYQKAEDIAERERLKLATPEDRAEADRILRELTPSLREISDRLSRRVESLERQESNARDADSDGIRASLAEARSLRSLAKYYSGWAEYYAAWLTRDIPRARAALEQFGPLLNAVRNRAATVDRLEPRMLRYEHVARAAVGCALANSLIGEHVEAARWLDALERSDSLPKAVDDQLFAYRLIVLSRADRWSELEVALKRRRQPEPGGPIVPLSTVESRLLAITTLDTSDRADLNTAAKSAIERLAQAALAELVAKGEVQQVLDIVSRYGTAPIGNDGFVVTYVRGLQAFDKARVGLAAANSTATSPITPNSNSKPPTDPAIINQFRAAAGLLQSAIASPDSKTYPNERAGAMITRGLALFNAGDFEDAAIQLEAAHAASTADHQKRDALWFAIVALDSAIAGGKVSARSNLDRLGNLYIQTYPGSDNATKLLLRTTNTASMSDERAIEVLSKVPAESPLWAAAQRQVVRLLYAGVRAKAPGPEREFAIARFSQAADALLRNQIAIASADTNAPAKEAAEEVILRARQLADVLLQSATPDLPRVEAALSQIEGLASFHGLDITPYASELAFRRLQLALARNDDASATRELDRIRTLGGPNVPKAETIVFQHAADRWKANPADTTLARRIVGTGLRLIDANAVTPNLAATIRDTAANAAFSIWQASDSSSREVSMRDIALKLDRAQIDAGIRTSAGLRRLAVTSEDAGDVAAALGCWNELLLGLAANSDAWWEARYNSFRLAAIVDPPQALAALTQHKILHPETPPEAWALRMSQVESAIRTAAENAASTPTTKPVSPSITPTKPPTGG